jgi:hypothetical protein
VRWLCRGDCRQSGDIAFADVPQNGEMYTKIGITCIEEFCISNWRCSFMSGGSAVGLATGLGAGRPGRSRSPGKVKDFRFPV